MKIRHVLIASAALAAGPAFAQDAPAPQPSADCASLLAQFDQAASTASSQQLKAAKSAHNKGEKLCSKGKTEEGAAKLEEAIAALSKPPSSERPADRQPTQPQPPADTYPPR